MRKIYVLLISWYKITLLFVWNNFFPQLFWAIPTLHLKTRVYKDFVEQITIR